MPSDVAVALEESGLRPDYDDRPFYQRNDYIGWIERAVKPETRRRRIDQMLDELERRDLNTGLVSMCVGGGMGTAMIIERE